MKKIYKTQKASIIIVNYNNAKYLDKCINSILNQTYKNKEIIVVDDKSKDNSIEILKKYKKEIIVIKNNKKTSNGSFNQINAYQKGFIKSKVAPLLQSASSMCLGVLWRTSATQFVKARPHCRIRSLIGYVTNLTSWSPAITIVLPSPI